LTTVAETAPQVLAAAEEAIAKGSKSFALASRLFDSETRARATLLYAWCRHCDDVIDGQELGQGSVESDEPPAVRLAQLQAATDRALMGELSGDLPFDALALVARAVEIPRRYPQDLLEGFRIDVDGSRIATEDDLLTYCYHVAGCVGVMMALVMGVAADDHATLARASDLGMSFQLNNIARDVAEDAARGRCYLPDAWLAKEGLSPATHIAEAHRAALHRVVARLVALAESYEASAAHGVPMLGRRQAWAVLSAGRIYGGIGRKVRARGTAALDVRTVTRRREKLYAVLLAAPEALVRARRPGATAPPRDGLWTPTFA
jgi:phytoene synthase